MNVIVSNRQKDIIDNANIDAIKDLNGLFNVEDLINKFKNYFFSRMILDATSIVNFASREVLTTLANEIGAEKLIILLPASPEPPMEFKKLLIELKIYNFTNDINDVIKFIEKPNTYDDAIKTLDVSYNNDNNMYVDNSIREESNSNNDVDNMGFVQESDLNKSSLGDLLNNFQFQQPEDNQNLSVDENTAFNSYEPETNTQELETNSYEMEAPKANDYVDMSNINNIVDNPSHKFLIDDGFNSGYNEVSKPTKKVIGIKNVTIHAGSTSLIYMLHRMAAENLKKNVLSIEVNKNDFRLFRNNKMISTNESELKNIINNSNEEIVFVDLNNYNGQNVCDFVLYLVEPSTIKLNGLMANNRNIFNELSRERVVLNKSLLSPNDINTLESEAGMKFFFNIEPLNDRLFNNSISRLLDMMDIK